MSKKRPKDGWEWYLQKRKYFLKQRCSCRWTLENSNSYGTLKKFNLSNVQVIKRKVLDPELAKKKKIRR